MSDTIPNTPDSFDRIAHTGRLLTLLRIAKIRPERLPWPEDTLHNRDAYAFPCPVCRDDLHDVIAREEKAGGVTLTCNGCHSPGRIAAYLYDAERASTGNGKIATVDAVSTNVTPLHPATPGTATPTQPYTIVPAARFAATPEAGAEPLVGTPDACLIPKNGLVMIYGDAGSGKTTITTDMGCHIGTGTKWLGIAPVPNRARVLLVENEGSRPLFRRKLGRKLDGWRGPEIGDYVLVHEAPWAAVSFAEPDARASLAAAIKDNAIDVVIIGPLAYSGVDFAGTLPEITAFTRLINDVRAQAGRPVTFILVHHPNRGGSISGAWEGFPDTLLHMQSQGHGRNRLYVQKARGSSEHHLKTYKLVWAPGDSYTLDDTPEETDADAKERIMTAIRENPGATWGTIEKLTPGIGAPRRRTLRDQLFTDRLIVNIAADELLYTVPERTTAHLYDAEDPTIRDLRPTPDADGTQTASARGAGRSEHLRPASHLKRDADVDADPAPPDSLLDAGSGPYAGGHLHPDDPRQPE